MARSSPSSTPVSTPRTPISTGGSCPASTSSTATTTRPTTTATARTSRGSWPRPGTTGSAAPASAGAVGSCRSRRSTPPARASTRRSQRGSPGRPTTAPRHQSVARRAAGLDHPAGGRRVRTGARRGRRRRGGQQRRFDAVLSGRVRRRHRGRRREGRQRSLRLLRLRDRLGRSSPRPAAAQSTWPGGALRLAVRDLDGGAVRVGQHRAAAGGRPDGDGGRRGGGPRGDGRTRGDRVDRVRRRSISIAPGVAARCRHALPGTDPRRRPPPPPPPASDARPETGAAPVVVTHSATLSAVPKAFSVSAVAGTGRISLSNPRHALPRVSRCAAARPSSGVARRAPGVVRWAVHLRTARLHAHGDSPWFARRQGDDRVHVPPAMKGSSRSATTLNAVTGRWNPASDSSPIGSTSTSSSTSA